MLTGNLQTDPTADEDIQGDDQNYDEKYFELAHGNETPSAKHTPPKGKIQSKTLTPLGRLSIRAVGVLRAWNIVGTVLGLWALILYVLADFQSFPRESLVALLQWGAIFGSIGMVSGLSLIIFLILEGISAKANNIFSFLSSGLRLVLSSANLAIALLLLEIFGGS